MNSLRMLASSDLHRSIIGALACVGGMACAGADLEERDLGSTSPGLTSSPDPSTGDRTPVVGADGWVDPFIMGHWVGHAEDLFAPSGPNGERPLYTFPSGSTEFTLDLELDDPTIPAGRLTFGAGTVPEPLPGVVYPPNFARAITPLSSSVQLPPLEGLSYVLYESTWRTTADVGVAAGTLSLGYSPNSAYVDWCSLQPTRPKGDGRFDCLTLSDSDDPTASCGTENADGSEDKYNCDLARLCNAPNVCSCTETECAAANTEPNDIWLIRDGEDLLGTLVGAVFDHGSPGRYMPVGTIRFQRVSP